jgi:hypothetical protein
MHLLSAPEGRASLTAVEAGVALTAFAIAFAWPRLGSRWFSSIERRFGRLARRKSQAVLVVGITEIVLRLALLPLIPIPLPFIHDDFSFLLAADTFAHGRLTNPTPAMWVHFESFHIDMQPTYMSMYFPGQGIVLAAGKVLFGHPWFGLLIVTALMCSAICWMLQAWLPPTWALLGGLMSIVHIGLFSYWINTYTGAGSLAALGGALVLGALPRFMRTMHSRYALLMAFGVAILANSRPFEGLLLSLVVAWPLARWIFVSKDRPHGAALLFRTAPAWILLVATAAGMGYYNYRVFGNPLTLPYKLNRATYGAAPYFIWQSPHPAPVYHNEEMRRLYVSEELSYFNRFRSPRLFGRFLLHRTVIRTMRVSCFYAGLAFLPAFLMIRRVSHDRRMRFLTIFLLIALALSIIQVFFITHYLAPFSAAFYAVGLQCGRHFRQWKLGSSPIGLALVRFMIAGTLLIACVRPFARMLQLRLPDRGDVAWVWLGIDNFGLDRFRVQRTLEQLPGQQLAVVRYSPSHSPDEEWVYNEADIDGSRVIWARELDANSNRDLFEYYKKRHVWLVEPDRQPTCLAPYSVQGVVATDQR